MVNNCYFLYCRAILYLEGNLESKVFSDPITGLVRRIREVAIRGDGISLSLIFCFSKFESLPGIFSLQVC
ncbi:hypothetical protein B296_00035345 [Ensete ventricosum]|uniref:Uncharacterized protein n=1 Tax=Ensete ventricosum TaxID=4639 RepID=A0A427A621_ENSVE|nr:hypothetical protein B296_00035345 [Ensete ventricosum]